MHLLVVWRRSHMSRRLPHLATDGSFVTGRSTGSPGVRIGCPGPGSPDVGSKPPGAITIPGNGFVIVGHVSCQTPGAAVRSRTWRLKSGGYLPGMSPSLRVLGMRIRGRRLHRSEGTSIRRHCPQARSDYDSGNPRPHSTRHTRAMVLRLTGLVCAIAGVTVAFVWNPMMCVTTAVGCASPSPGSAPCPPPVIYCSSEYVPLRVAIAVVSVAVCVALFVLASRRAPGRA
jgi:hypothetical protein